MKNSTDKKRTIISVRFTDAEIEMIRAVRTLNPLVEDMTNSDIIRGMFRLSYQHLLETQEQCDSESQAVF